MAGRSHCARVLTSRVSEREEQMGKICVFLLDQTYLVVSEVRFVFFNRMLFSPRTGPLPHPSMTILFEDYLGL